MPPLGWRKAVDGGVKGTKGKHSAEHSDSPSNPPLVPERGGAAIEALGGKLGVLDTQRERDSRSASRGDEADTHMEIDTSTPTGPHAMRLDSSSENTSSAGMTPPIRSIKLKLKVKATKAASPPPERAPTTRGRGRGRGRGGRGGRGRGRARKIVLEEVSPSEEDSPVEELALPESEDDASGSEQDANVDVTVASADDVDADDPDTDQLAEPDTMIDLDDELDAEGEVDAEDYMDVEGEMDISAASKRLTARQAALVAGGSNMDHVMLPDAPSRKTQRTEAEMALRRSETARKRKHQDAQRLEDEKTETINRLLKKQSVKARNKKLLDTPMDDAAIPGGEPTSTPPDNRVTVPSYRWVSSSKDASVALSFSLPQVANGLQTDGETTSFTPSQPPVTRPTATCAVSGCTLTRKYRLAGASDFEKGACGMDHLKLLKTQVV